MCFICCVIIDMISIKIAIATVQNLLSYYKRNYVYKTSINQKNQSRRSINNNLAEGLSINIGVPIIILFFTPYSAHENKEKPERSRKQPKFHERITNK